MKKDSQLIGSFWSAYAFELGYVVIYQLIGVDEHEDPVMRNTETNTTKSISSRALFCDTYLQKWQCPHCKRWLSYPHPVEERCFHSSVTPLNQRLFPDDSISKSSS